MEKNVKLVIPVKKSASDGILAIIEYVKAKELANGKSAKDLTNTYMFKGSYALATLIKNFYRDEVSFVCFDVANADANTTLEHACVVLKKKNAEPEYFDINGKKSLDEMRKYVARAAKSTVKNVEVKDGYFYAITSTTVPMFNEIERAGKPAKTTTVVKAEPAKKVATKTASTKAPAKATKPAAKKTVETKKPAAKKPVAKTTKAAAKPATKVVAKKPAAKPAAKKATTAKKPVAKKPATKAKK